MLTDLAVACLPPSGEVPLLLPARRCGERGGVWWRGGAVAVLCFVLFCERRVTFDTTRPCGPCEPKSIVVVNVCHRQQRQAAEVAGCGENRRGKSMVFGARHPVWK